MKKRVLVVAYSQAGQLADVVRAVTAPLQTSNSIEVVFEWLQPQTPYPFPFLFSFFCLLCCCFLILFLKQCMSAPRLCIHYKSAQKKTLIW